MRLILSLVCGASLALSGCIAFPELPRGARVDIVAIVDSIECEIQRALLRDFPRHYWLLGWAATMTLHLQTKTESVGTGDISLSVPLMPETFGLTLKAGPEKYYHSKGGFTFKTPLADIAYKACPQPDEDPPPNKSVLTGRTGAGDWLERVSNDATFAGICPQSIDFALDFRITLDGEANPKITGIEVGDGKLGVGFKPEAEKINEHKLSLTAVPVADSKDKEEQKKVDAIFAQAFSLVSERTGRLVSKEDIRACTPLDPSFLMVRRGPINQETLDDLNAADLRSILRAISNRDDD